eukprot:2545594-Karenia_brevis.AAC.1
MEQEALAVKDEEPGSSSGLQLRGPPPEPQPREARPHWDEINSSSGFDWEAANSHDQPGGGTQGEGTYAR